MVCEVRSISAKNKCELLLKFMFDNKLERERERELSTELGVGEATSLVNWITNNVWVDIIREPGYAASESMRDKILYLHK